MSVFFPHVPICRLTPVPPTPVARTLPLSEQHEVWLLVPQLLEPSNFAVPFFWLSTKIKYIL